MSYEKLILPNHIEQVELQINPYKNLEKLYRFHMEACRKCPNALRLRSMEDFEKHPDHVLFKVWLKGWKKPISAGMAVLFDVDRITVELGSLYVAPLFRGLGIGSMLIDTLAIKFNDDNNLQQHRDVRIIAKVRYGNSAPISTLNRTGFKVEAIQDEKSFWCYDPSKIEDAATRLHEVITKYNAIVEDSLLSTLIAVPKNTTVQ